MVFGNWYFNCIFIAWYNLNASKYSHNASSPVFFLLFQILTSGVCGGIAYAFNIFNLYYSISVAVRLCKSRRYQFFAAVIIGHVHELIISKDPFSILIKISKKSFCVHLI